MPGGRPVIARRPVYTRYNGRSDRDWYDRDRHRRGGTPHKGVSKAQMKLQKDVLKANMKLQKDVANAHMKVIQGATKMQMKAAAQALGH